MQALATRLAVFARCQSSGKRHPLVQLCSFIGLGKGAELMLRGGFFLFRITKVVLLQGRPFTGGQTSEDLWSQAS